MHEKNIMEPCNKIQMEQKPQKQTALKASSTRARSLTFEINIEFLSAIMLKGFCRNHLGFTYFRGGNQIGL